MTHGADIIRHDFGQPDAVINPTRQALLAQTLLAEAFAQLIRHRLSAASHCGAVRRDLYLITQLRQSGMARLNHIHGQGFTLSMHGTTATANTARGVLWEWSNAVLGTESTPA